MFDGIAHRYDFLNHVLSLFRDVAWRRACCRSLMSCCSDKSSVLDLCGGTGDFIIAYRHIVGKPRISVVGDFSFGMLSKVKDKTTVPVLQIDAMRMAFAEGSFDVILNGFGMRNLPDTRKGLEETFRVLSPGGYFLTLEFFAPDNVFNKLFYGVFAPLFIPVVGAFFSGKKEAYEYLVNSVRRFLKVTDYASMARAVGFEIIYVKPCDFGIAYRVLLVKPFHPGVAS
jgi:demethylmenaquinone methyltransferase/2-methoxy-6-polyprenyl-1,4-benzoquinol methylase